MDKYAGRWKVRINHINKANFLQTYIIARQSTYTTANIQNGFKTTRIHPFNPFKVFSQFHLVVYINTPLESRPFNYSFT